MESRWTVTRADAWDAQVEFGPGGDSLPRAFGACVKYEQTGADVELSGRFDGQRIVVTRLNLGCESVTPRLLSDLTLASAVHDVGLRLLNRGVFGDIDARPRPMRTDIRDELQLVATLYWREHATWGNPTQAVSRTWGVPKSTANRWLQQTRETYELPA